MDMNSECRVNLRRVSDHLALAGKGFILFGVWSVMKLFMMLTMQKEEMQEIMDNVGPSSLSDGAIRAIILCVFGVCALLILQLHYMVGRSAVRFSKGNRKSIGFLILGTVLLIVTILGMGSYFQNDDGTAAAITPTILASILVDLTVSFILIQMIVSAVMIKKYSKQTEQREA